MANPEHLAKLKEGVKAWNQWREENPDVIPNLRMSDLSDMDLFEVNLESADLCETNLERADLGLALLESANFVLANLANANLESAFLGQASFRSANLELANLQAADLELSNFESANLKSANLSFSYINYTNFSFANLLKANLEGAHISLTKFIGLDLSETRGLDALKSFGISSLDHQTLMRSKNLPEKFLQDCGLPQQFIDNLPSLLSSLNPIQFYSCFISYSSKDEEFAKRLHADLREEGIRCWFAPEDMKIGDKIRKHIDETIRIHDKLLLILSEESVNSAWVEKEVESAFEQETIRKKRDGFDQTVLFPIQLDKAVMEIQDGWPADIRRTRHIGDFTDWKNHDSYQAAFDRLLRDLNKSTE
jgi:uncharacterized protein YjbI with pentapeptide repeats